MKRLLLLFFFSGLLVSAYAEYAEVPFKLCEDASHQDRVVDTAVPEQLGMFVEKITEIIEHEIINDHRPLEEVVLSKALRVQFANEPVLPLKDWVKLLFRSHGLFQLSSRIGFYAVIYLKRLHDKKMKLGYYNIRRTFMICCLVAYKTFDDDALSMRTNDYWISIAFRFLKDSYPLELVNEMEHEILRILDWRTEVRVSEMDWLLSRYFTIDKP